MDLDYYIGLGGYAYSRLASHDDAFADVFGELAEKFVPVVDVLSDISDRSGRPTATCCGSTSDGFERAVPGTVPCSSKRAHSARFAPDSVESVHRSQPRKNYTANVCYDPRRWFGVAIPPQYVDFPPPCNCPPQLTSGKTDAAEPY